MTIETLPSTASKARSAGLVELYEAEIRFGDPSEGVLALDRTSLKLQPGSFTALIGPSGCGKSTLMNAVAGFVPLSHGFVRIDGEPMTKPHPGVGVIFQQYALFPWFTARGNIEFALANQGVSRSERTERALAALEEVGLAGQGEKYPGQLSGGMKQRVAIARTLVCEPSVLLMDEPFGALDAQTRLSMHALLLRLLARHRATVLFVTHDVDEALLLADTVHVMSRAPGRILATYAIDTPRPRSVARFDAALSDLRATIVDLLHPTTA
ncbi:ABC transporter ATP-binding protein [Aureimonas ureilytica]|uniref:ABC transporter ATP-binding protein n=1 Tax=Aureimonas ureilytica TaxID=401562 RepID=A0A175RDW8_9HYPH|nr:ABC transporter ATP-binding protein [Aureimonas ureilytica]KTR01413.1 ABC transporter ATP-binding protein [Aureimonas ureilytica]